MIPVNNQLLIDARSDWKCNVTALMEGFIQKKMADGASLRQTISELHKELSKHPQFHQAMKNAINCSHSASTPCHWLPLVDNTAIKLGLLTLFHTSPIPLHDHPGAFGIQLVLSGRVSFRQFDPIPDNDSSDRVVTLIKVTDQAIGVGETSTYTTTERNLHAIKVLTSRSVLLSLMINICEGSDRSWYFPVSIFTQETRCLYRRLTRHKIDQFHHGNI